MSTVLAARRTPPPVRSASRRRWVATDALAILLGAALVVGAFGPAYGTPVWRAGLGGAVVGTALGLTAGLRRWPVWRHASAAAVAYLALGGACALPSTAYAGLVPTLATLQGLVTGLVTAWKASLTVAPPIGELGSLLVVPYAVLLVATTVAGRLAVDRRRATTAWIPLALAASLALLFGLRDGAQPLVIGLGFALGVPMWTAYRRSFLRQALVGRPPRVRLTRAAIGAVVLALAGGVAVAVLPALRAVDQRRVVLREVVAPPVDVRQWASPLQEMRAQVIDRADRVLLTAEGLPAGTRVRIATLDAYDGTTFQASNESEDGGGLAFRRVGETVPAPQAGVPVSARLTAADYAAVWLPTAGAAHTIRFAGPRRLALKDRLYVNADTATAVTAAGLASGDAYELGARVPEPIDVTTLRRAESGTATLPPLPPLPEAIKARAARAVEGSQGDGDTALRIQADLRGGYYSHGQTYASLPGHSLARINRLFTAEQMVGDEEQYAVAFALIAREAGLPARVVYGFAPTPAAGRVELRGRDVTAWVEVKYADAGWVPYDAAPDPRRVPPTKPQNPQGPTSPQVDNPPPPPDRPDRLPPDQTDPEPPGEGSRPPRNLLWTRYGPWALGIGLPLVLLALPFVVIGGAKVRRRRVRSAAPSAADRVAGGWAEVIDRARDLGVPLSPAGTRIENARAVGAAFARSADGASDPLQLAFRADATSFGTGTPSDRQAGEYWAGVRGVLRGMTRSVGPWRRIRGLLSLRSLRSPAAWRREVDRRTRWGAWRRDATGWLRAAAARLPSGGAGPRTR